MKLPLTLVAAVAAVLSNCGTPIPKNAITIDRLNELERAPALSARKVRVTTRIERNGTITGLPAVTTHVGKTAKIDLPKDFIYPVAFNLATTTPTKSQPLFPMTPTVPTAFETKRLGTTLEITPSIRGAFVELSGFLTFRNHAGFGRGAGEGFSPITDSNRKFLYTENKVLLPHFKTDVYRVHTMGLPGTDQVVEFDDVKIHIKCEL